MLTYRLMEAVYLLYEAISFDNCSLVTDWPETWGKTKLPSWIKISSNSVRSALTERLRADPNRTRESQKQPQKNLTERRCLPIFNFHQLYLLFVVIENSP